MNHILFKGDNSSIRVYGGNELDLVIIKFHIEFMGGKIKINIELGVG